MVRIIKVKTMLLKKLQKMLEENLETTKKELGLDKVETQ
jgi:hypothetical protein